MRYWVWPSMMISLVAVVGGCEAEIEEEFDLPVMPLVEAPEPPVVPTTSPSQLGAPVIERARLKRKGRKVRIAVGWSEVPGAEAYQVQLSKTLTFTRAMVDERIDASRFVFKRLKPKIYFVRVRALGRETAGPFGRVRILDATKRRRKGKQGKRGGDLFAGDKPAKGRLRLAWTRPSNRAMLSSPSVKLEGDLTVGATLTVNDGAPIESRGTFSIPMTLTHGRNRITLVARLGEQLRRIWRDIYYIDPERLGPVRERFEQVQRDLREMEILRREIAATAAELAARIKSADKTEEIGVLKTELQEIQKTGEALEKEVHKAIKALDQILRG